MKQLITEAEKARMQKLAGIITENLSSEPADDGIHITGFSNEDVDSLFLTQDESVHKEMIAEGPVGSSGVIEDQTTGIKVYWSFGYK